MIKRTVDFVVKTCGAEVIAEGEQIFQGVSTDSRTIQPGELFVALVGPLFNGHNFVQIAMEKGSHVVIVSERQIGEIPADVTVLWVEDTLVALQQLAKAYLDQVNPIRIAVTGSTGKSSTKEIVHAVMSQKYRTFKNKGNLNNHIGLPLTVLHMPENTQVLVIEMGMNHYGEIRTLCDIIKPNDAIITNIGDSHIEFFGSREGILKSKMEITEAFDHTNTLWLNGEDPLLRPLTSDNYTVVSVGQGTPYFYDTYKATSLSTSQFQLFADGEVMEILMPLIGKHNASNALLAVAVARKYGLTLREIKRGLESVETLKMRLQVNQIHGLILVDDTYNASPDSVVSALDVLLELPAKRHILVFADILELGDLSETIHKQLGERVNGLGLSAVFSFGNQSVFFHKSLLSCSAFHFENSAELTRHLLTFLNQGDAVMFKGSRGMHVESVLDQVIERGFEHVVDRD